ncbi:AB-hydrolase YheT [Neolentinus lepideus HHB14362 ss-1]|uniref:AB-hydrolase YheT n=1 Tax=Neolentinus lepideus HHB14362 ss-1 TaxID=1314782 RepID=A0A165T6N6_9AGAM|nr:AB-hydrolase YheT [Neolentinus lepideus HHB14362 ss-1]
MGVILSLFINLFRPTYTPTLYFPTQPAYLLYRKARHSNECITTSLRDVIEGHCRTLLEEYRPVWWLPGGHIQTGYCVVGDFSTVDKVDYDRKLLRLKDGGTLGLDFTPPASERTLSEDTPIIVVMHGLTGGSHEAYVRSIIAPTCTPVEQGGLGYRAMVVNFRGCAGTPVTSPQLYTGGHTDDLRQALMYLSQLYPEAPLIGLGFSLGANVIARYLGQEGNKSRLLAAAVLGCPWDLVKNSERIEGDLFYREIYSKALARNLLKMLRTNAAHLSRLAAPHTPTAQALANTLQLKSPYLKDFDVAWTSVAGATYPPFPMDSADAYYEWAGSAQHVHNIRVPLLCVNASDDPIVRDLPIEEVRQNGWVCLAVTRHGGHLGWFEKPEKGDREAKGWFGLRRWVRKPVLEWFRATAEHLVGEQREIPELYEQGGWIVERGRESLGFREVEGGGKVIGVEGEAGLLAGL